MSKPTHEYEHLEYDIESVMKAFASGFTTAKNKEILSREWFYDPRKGKVIFRLLVTEKAVKKH